MNLRDIPYDQLMLYMGGEFEQICPYCGNEDGPWEIDHILPQALGGTDDDSNKQVICMPCNRAKGVMTDQEYREWISKLVKFHNKNESSSVASTDADVASTDADVA